jgi:hypothetical protein
MERAGRIIGKLKIPKEVIDSETLARSAWPAAVGKRIALRTRVLRLVRNTLVVECEDSIWQRQLNTLSGQILRNLAALAGDGVVASLDLRPMTPRRGMQMALSLDGALAASQKPQMSMFGDDEADRIQDPVFRMLYKQSRRKAAARETGNSQQTRLFEDNRKASA